MAINGTTACLLHHKHKTYRVNDRQVEQTFTHTDIRRELVSLQCSRSCARSVGDTVVHVRVV